MKIFLKFFSVIFLSSTMLTSCSLLSIRNPNEVPVASDVPDLIEQDTTEPTLEIPTVKPSETVNPLDITEEVVLEKISDLSDSYFLNRARILVEGVHLEDPIWSDEITATTSYFEVYIEASMGSITGTITFKADMTLLQDGLSRIEIDGTDKLTFETDRHNSLSTLKRYVNENYSLKGPDGKTVSNSVVELDSPSNIDFEKPNAYTLILGARYNDRFVVRRKVILEIVPRAYKKYTMEFKDRYGMNIGRTTVIETENISIKDIAKRAGVMDVGAAYDENGKYVNPFVKNYYSADRCFTVKKVKSRGTPLIIQLVDIIPPYQIGIGPREREIKVVEGEYFTDTDLWVKEDSKYKFEGWYDDVTKMRIMPGDEILFTCRRLKAKWSPKSI